MSHPLSGKALFDHNFNSANSNGYYWGKVEGRDHKRTVLDPSQGEKNYPSEKIYWMNKNSVKASFSAAAVAGSVTMLGPIQEIVAGTFVAGGPEATSTTMLNMLADNNALLHQSTQAAHTLLH